jgi:pyruvate dehydrogenase E2 component (dihydrolipoamide acetyltransferase)
MAAREQHNAESRIRYSVNDLILMATAKALAKNRNLLCSFDGDGIIYKPGVDLGVAVSTDDGEGLLVPVIREADTLSADALALSAHELIKRARERTVTQGECEGSAFTVTNLGMYGVEAFTPLLNPPNAAILGVCSIYDGVAVRNGAVEVRKLLHLCLTFDHRTIDGVQAAKFNLAVREYLEHPDSLI